MQGPIDYSLNVIDPISAGLAGFNMGRDRLAGEQAYRGEEQRQGFAATQADYAAQDQQQQNTLFEQGQQGRQMELDQLAQDRAKAEKFQADLGGLAARVKDGTATAADFTALTLEHPEFADELKGSFDGYSEDQRKGALYDMSRIGVAIKAGRTDLAKTMLEDRLEAQRATGMTEEAGMTEFALSLLETSPEAALATIGLGMQAMGASDEMAKVFGAGPERKVQSTVDIGSGVTVTIFSDGSKEVTDATGKVLIGPDATEAISAAEQRAVELKGQGAAATAGGRIDTEIAKGGEAEAEKQVGKVNAEAIKIAGERLATVSSTIRNYDDAISALDAGANTGAIAAKLPTLSAASTLLENAKLRLGLDVIASVTFGALSEGERNAAMATALPTGLPEAELREWIKTRQQAELKIARIQTEAINHFSQPGKSQRELQREWVKKYKAEVPGLTAFLEGGGSGSPPQTDQAEEDADFLKYGAP